MRYSIEPRQRRYVKGYVFMSFARNFIDKYSKSLMDKGIDVSKKFAKTAGKNIIMEYQKIANLVDDTPNQPSKFRTRNWVEINDESRGAYDVNSQIKFKTTMLKSSLCDYSDAYILVKRTISVTNTAAANNINKKVIFKNCAPFTNCISEINNVQIGNAKDIDIVMPMYNLIEYSDNYGKTTGRLWQYCKDIPTWNDNNAIIIFTDNNLTDSFKFKAKVTGQTGNNGTKDVEIMVPLKYLSNFWRTLEMPLINCEVNLILTWSSTRVFAAVGDGNQAATFSITNTKLYVPVATLSTQENTKFFQQLKPGFKRVINWNKYLSKPELLAQNPNLNHLVEPSFQGVNRLFVLTFQNDDDRTSDDEYYLPTVEIKDYNIMINGENFFDQPIKNNKLT